MSFVKHLCAAAFVFSGGAASASTATFNMQVTESIFTELNIPNPPQATLPALGDTGTATISLPGFDASNTTPFGDPDNPPNAGSVLATITIGSLTSSLEAGFGSVAFASDTTLRFANGSFGSINVDFPRDAGATPTYAGSFTLLTDPDGFTPSTFGDVVTALMDPTARLVFSFNGTTFDGIDTSFRAESFQAPVPIPAGGVLLASVLGAGAVFKRKRKA